MSQGLDFHYLHPDGRLEPPTVSIQYAVAYRDDWFRMALDFERLAPSLAKVWGYTDSDVEPTDELRREVENMLEQPSVCPWGGTMEARVRSELAAIGDMITHAATNGLKIRVSGYARPRDLSLYVRLGDGTLDEPFACLDASSYPELDQVVRRLGGGSQVARVWNHAQAVLSSDAARKLYDELLTPSGTSTKANSFVLRATAVCESATARRLGIHVAGGSYGEGLQIMLLRAGTRVDLHPGLNAAMSLSIPGEYKLIGRVWDYATNTLSGEEVRQFRHEVRSLLEAQPISPGMTSDLREAEFLAFLAEKHGLDLLFLGP